MQDLREKYLSLISGATDEASLENLRVQAVGKKGEISLRMRSLGKMTPEERQEAGPALNALKDEVNSALVARKSSLSDAALEERLKGEWLDVTLPARLARQGSIHPISQVWGEVTEIFADMGFSVAEGPQIESDWYNLMRLTFRGIILRARKWIHFTPIAIKMMTDLPMFCELTPVPYRSGQWKKLEHL